jgi:hypothetical protein
MYIISRCGTPLRVYPEDPPPPLLLIGCSSLLELGPSFRAHYIHPFTLLSLLCLANFFLADLNRVRGEGHSLSAVTYEIAFVCLFKGQVGRGGPPGGRVRVCAWLGGLYSASVDLRFFGLCSGLP